LLYAALAGTSEYRGVSVLPRSPSAVVRASRRRLSAHGGDGGLGFALRLLAGFVLTLGLVQFVGIAIIDRNASGSQIQQYAAMQRSDVRIFERLGRSSLTTQAALRQIGEVLRVLGERPGTLEAQLLDASGVVIASGTPGTLGTVDTDPRITRVIVTNHAYVGHEGDPKLDQRDFEFIAPVRLHSGRYAYEMTYDHSTLNGALASVRRALILVGGGGLLVGVLLFYLVGGRTVIRRHRMALARATRDGMTDLPNQRAFYDELPQAISSAARYDEPLALVVLDIDDFKFLNDRYGHPHGDAVIKRVAEVLNDRRPSDRAYRIGGDEFAAVLPHADRVGVQALMRRMVRRFDDGGVKVSIGLASLRPGQSTADSMRAEADAALYEAKRRGGGQVVHYEEIRETVAVTTADTKAAVRRLLDERGIDVHFQPIWNLATFDLVGVEALARPHAGYGLAGPYEAFDVAEQLGRTHELDELCASRALAEAHRLPRGAALFVNVCPQTLDLDSDSNDWFLATVQRAGLTPEQVVVEVTERFGGRAASVVKCLQRMKAQGFRIALDDVGTGNSGLAMLRDVGADYLKIDRGIISASATEPAARAVLLAMATFADLTGATVIAEGIEDLETLEYLRSLDRNELNDSAMIQAGQGYQLGRPSPLMPPARLDDVPRAA
jgi:diguanylate cyclase (GGDEF)-like protein